MGTVNVNFRLDEDEKNKMAEVCKKLGISMSAAFTLFAKKMAREKRIPFEISIDPYYSDVDFKTAESLYKAKKETEVGNCSKSNKNEVVLPQEEDFQKLEKELEIDINSLKSLFTQALNVPKFADVKDFNEIFNYLKTKKKQAILKNAENVEKYMSGIIKNEIKETYKSEKNKSEKTSYNVDDNFKLSWDIVNGQ